MRLNRLVVAAAGLGVGYVLTTRQGRAQFESAKDRARVLAQDPRTRRTVSVVAEKVREHADLAPFPTSLLLREVADRIHRATSSPD